MKWELSSGVLVLTGDCSNSCLVLAMKANEAITAAIAQIHARISSSACASSFRLIKVLALHAIDDNASDGDAAFFHFFHSLLFR